MIRERTASQGWDGVLIVDAGDAFSATPAIMASRREATVATAEFLVDQYGQSGLAALAVGDRDLALGRETLLALAKRARFPFVSANLVDGASGEPIFPGHVVVERAGLRIGVIGLMSPTGAENTLANVRDGDAKPSWRVVDPAPAARTAVAALAAEGVDLVVALSHLAPPEQAAVAAAAPSIRLFLGGQSMGGRPPGAASARGSAAFEAGMKGKQLGLVTLDLAADTASNAPVAERDQKKALQDRLARARVRAESLEKRIATAKRPPAEAAPAEATATNPRRRIPPPTTLWEQQLAGTRAEIQMAEADLKALEAAAPVPGNTVTFELANLGQNVVDDPAIKAAVDAFRVRYPDPSKLHAPIQPQVRHPTPGRGAKSSPPSGTPRVTPTQR